MPAKCNIYFAIVAVKNILWYSLFFLRLRCYEYKEQNMALARCCPFISHLGNQLYFNEKGIKVLFTLSAGFPENSYLLFVPSSGCASEHFKIQQE
jgi:hypothetical protein